MPIMQVNESGGLQKTKVTENIEVALWDRWNFKLDNEIKQNQDLEYREDKSKGIDFIDEMRDSTPLYFPAITNARIGEEEGPQLKLNAAREC